MAIVFTNLGASSGTSEVAPDIRNLTDLNQYTLASWDPPNDGVVFLCIYNGENAGDYFVTGVTGNGDFWEPILDQSFRDSGGTNTRELEIYAARGQDLTTGVTTIDYGGVTQLCCYVSVFHATGLNTTLPLTDNIYVNGNTHQNEGVGTGVTIDFAPISDPANRGLIFVGHDANEAITGDASWTKMDDMNGAGPVSGIISMVDEDGLSDPTLSWASNVAYGFVGFEIKVESPSPPATPRINVIRSTQRW